MSTILPPINLRLLELCEPCTEQMRKAGYPTEPVEGMRSITECALCERRANLRSFAVADRGGDAQ